MREVDTGQRARRPWTSGTVSQVGSRAAGRKLAKELPLLLPPLAPSAAATAAAASAAIASTHTVTPTLTDNAEISRLHLFIASDPPACWICLLIGGVHSSFAPPLSQRTHRFPTTPTGYPTRPNCSPTDHRFHTRRYTLHIGWGRTASHHPAVALLFAHRKLGPTITTN